MKAKLIILGSGSSVGVPRIDGYWGSCKKKGKRTQKTIKKVRKDLQVNWIFVNIQLFRLDIIKSHPAMGYYLIQVDICD